MARNKTAGKIYSRGERIGLECSKCGRFVDNLTPDIGSIECWVCIAGEAAAPMMPKQVVKKSGEERPRGWQRRKEYVSPSGKTYSFGKEVIINERTNTTDTPTIQRSKTKIEVGKRRGRPKGSKNKKGIHSKH